MVKPLTPRGVDASMSYSAVRHGRFAFFFGSARAAVGRCCSAAFVSLAFQCGAIARVSGRGWALASQCDRSRRRFCCSPEQVRCRSATISSSTPGRWSTRIRTSPLAKFFCVPPLRSQARGRLRAPCSRSALSIRLHRGLETSAMRRRSVRSSRKAGNSCSRMFATRTIPPHCSRRMTFTFRKWCALRSDRSCRCFKRGGYPTLRQIAAHRCQPKRRHFQAEANVLSPKRVALQRLESLPFQVYQLQSTGPKPEPDVVLRKNVAGMGRSGDRLRLRPSAWWRAAGSGCPYRPNRWQTWVDDSGQPSARSPPARRSGCTRAKARRLPSSAMRQ